MRFERVPAPLPGVELWGAKVGKWSFCVTKSDDDGRYRASWANHDPDTVPLGGRRLTTWIGEPDEGFTSFQAATGACEETLKQLRRPA